MKKNIQQFHAIPKWIVIWLSISIIIITWEMLFIVMRPDSFADGSLAAIWMPYAKYVKIDTSYADLQNDFVNALPLMDLIEITIGLTALFLNYKRNNAAIVFAFSSLLLTGTKTIFVFVQEAIGGFKHVGHNAISEIILFYVLPNSIWIFFPFLAVFMLGRYLTDRMDNVW